MTSVPKPLKFLRPHYDTLKARLEVLPPGAPNREPLADVVSRAALWHAVLRCTMPCHALLQPA